MRWKCAAFVGAMLVAACADAGAQITFSRDVARIVHARCGRCHHPNGPAPFSLLTYADARQRATLIASVTKNRYMPPWQAEPGYGEFVDHQPLTDSEIDTIQRWVAGGAAEGSRRDLPPTPKFAQGWQLGTPDLIVGLERPYMLRPEGPDFSRLFVFQLPTEVTRYVRGFEFRPGNRNVIHHANIRVDRTPASRQLDSQDPAPGYEGLLLKSAVYPDGHFLGWTPGQAAPLLPKGLSWRLDPHTDLVVEMHLVPSGKVEQVQPMIGLYFTDEPPQRAPEMLRLGVQSIDIPPGESLYTIADSFVLPVDVDVLAVQPHAHYRAREIVGSATLPDGTARPLIYIKDWDFRWQHVYRYADPISLPKGTTLSMRYTYDNSADNPRNPQQPPRRVLWGQRTTDEMGDLWVQMLARNDRDRETLSATIHPKEMMEDVIGYEIMIRRDPSNAQLHDDAAVVYLALGRHAQAAIHFEASAKLKADSAPAHFNLATVLALMGRLNDATVQYRRALEITPDYAQAHNNLGNVLLLQGNLDQALRHFQEALRLDPRNAEAHYNVGSIARARGDLSEAVRRFRQSIALKPDSTPALVGLAWILAAAPEASMRSPHEAVALSTRAAELTRHRDASVLDALAAACASTGDFDRAVTVSQAALDLRPTAPLAAALRQRQELYRQHRAYVSLQK